ncbi:hypothetical protein [Actinacidiphila acidipaludis]|uniref:Uncharacterized protein n=1 Tax=Actinacidiphila acidipaludis TaxID=2873382 RepID=A0ABS7Q4B4_9ACTN|nr:hypothetical protein [Streptomyces acidipaludis]MBY8877991.1 hypothetical protein [Streptomyces acidipaludis]
MLAPGLQGARCSHRDGALMVELAEAEGGPLTLTGFQPRGVRGTRQVWE